MSDLYGDEFQQKSKYSHQTKWESLDWNSQPEIYKFYTKNKSISLPSPKLIPDMPLNEILYKRQSIRQFKPLPISLEQLSALLWASSGISHSRQEFDFRTAPSAGALYPIETYLIVNNVENLEPGVYHYNIKDHKLDIIEIGDFSMKIAKAALGQRMCAEAPVVFIWSAVFFRSKWKYKQRGYRYMYLDAGHIGENLALAAVAMKLGSCQIAAFFDEDVNSIIKIDGEDESTLYMSIVGMPLE